MTGFPKNHQLCLLYKSCSLFVFTVLDFSLVAISVDRYFAVCRYLTYKSKSTRNTIITIISYWILGFVFGFLPFFGWNSGYKIVDHCEFRKIVDFDYLLYVHCPSLLLPSIIMIVLYTLIYRAIIKQNKKLQTMNQFEGLKRKKVIQATNTIALVVGSFVILWIPGLSK